jgi:hypothetical protein
MASTYEVVATTTLTGSQASVTFNPVSSAYTDLVLVTSVFQSNGGDKYTYVRFNGDSGSNYSYTYMDTYNGTANSGRVPNASFILLAYTQNVSNSVPLMGTMNIQNYSNSTTNKTGLVRFGAATPATGAYVGMWRNTAAITSIQIVGGSGNLEAGSTFTLYGIKAA